MNRCDDLQILPCARQVATAQLPLAGTSITLDYSSDRADGRLQDKAPSAAQIGLGGWTLSVLDSLDPAGKTFVAGNGTVRHIAGFVAGGRLAVADVTGTRVDMFDSRGRLDSTVDATTGAVLVSFTWTDHGLATVSDVGGVALSVIRAPDGTPLRLQVPAGASTALGFHEGRLAALGYPDGSVTQIRTAANGCSPVFRTPRTVTSDTATTRRAGSPPPPMGAAPLPRTSGRHPRPGCPSKTDYPSGARAVDAVTVDGSATRWSHTAPSGTVTSILAAGIRRTLTQADGETTDLTLAPDPRWGTDAPILASVTDGGRER